MKNTNHPSMTSARISEHEFKYSAARRALAIANKLPHSEFRKKHISRIFRNLNKLRVA